MRKTTFSRLCSWASVAIVCLLLFLPAQSSSQEGHGWRPFTGTVDRGGTVTTYSANNPNWFQMTSNGTVQFAWTSDGRVPNGSNVVQRTFMTRDGYIFMGASGRVMPFEAREGTPSYFNKAGLQSAASPAKLNSGHFVPFEFTRDLSQSQLNTGAQWENSNKGWTTGSAGMSYRDFEDMAHARVQNGSARAYVVRTVPQFGPNPNPGLSSARIQFLLPHDDYAGRRLPNGYIPGNGLFQPAPPDKLTNTVLEDPFIPRISGGQGDPPIRWYRSDRAQAMAGGVHSAAQGALNAYAYGQFEKLAIYNSERFKRMEEDQMRAMGVYEYTTRRNSVVAGGIYYSSPSGFEVKVKLSDGYEYENGRRLTPEESRWRARQRQWEKEHPGKSYWNDPDDSSLGTNLSFQAAPPRPWYKRAWDWVWGD